VKTMAQATARAFGIVALLALVATAWVWLPSVRPGARVSAVIFPPSEEVRLARERILAKDDVADRLIDGELTLLEAAARFRRINDSSTRSAEDFRREFPGDSDGEKACRQVIAWVHSRAIDRFGATPADLFADCLKRELDEILEQDPGVELPW